MRERRAAVIGAGLAGAEAAGGEVRLVVQRRDGVQHPLPGRRPDVRVVVHDVGHRLDRHLGEPGDVVDRRSHRCPSAVRCGRSV